MNSRFEGWVEGLNAISGEEKCPLEVLEVLQED
jgi:hypothetical protein